MRRARPLAALGLLLLSAILSCDSTAPRELEVGFSLSPSAPTLFIGSSIQLDPTAAQAGVVPPGPFKWSSSNSAVATVDANGVIRGVSAGSAVVRAIADTEIGETTVTVITGGSTLEAGVLHACGIAANGLYCWGDNTYGQLGNGTRSSASTPQKVGGDFNFSSVSPAWDFTCGLAAGGAYCWGSAASGQLGNGTSGFNVYVTSPVKVIASEGFVKVSSSGTPTNESGALCSDATCFAHSCALTSTGELSCWGSGVGAAPVKLSLDVRFRDVSLGYTYRCAIDLAQIGHCWGSGAYKESGPGPDGSSLPPLQVTETFQSISAFADHTCALSVGGDIYCWGANTSGQLGAPSNAECRTRFATTPCRAEPVRVPSPHKFLAVSVGAATRERSDLSPVSHTCAISTDLQVFCWGSNQFGELGNGSTQNAPTPTAIASTLKFRSITTGFFFTCGVALDGAPYCWGINNRGQLGNGSTANSPVPAAIPGISLK